MTDTSNLTFDSIPMSLSMPEALSWHMILDHELMQLSSRDTGLIGSIGFVCLGSALGLIPSLVTALDKVNTKPPLSMSSGDVAAIAATVGTAVGAVICLIIFGIYRYRNSGLAAKIRARTRRGLKFSDGANAETSLPSGTMSSAQ
jgi:hypothetical protein